MNRPLRPAMKPLVWLVNWFVRPDPGRPYILAALGILGLATVADALFFHVAHSFGRGWATVFLAAIWIPGWILWILASCRRGKSLETAYFDSIFLMLAVAVVIVSPGSILGWIGFYVASMIVLWVLVPVGLSVVLGPRWTAQPTPASK